MGRSARGVRGMRLAEGQTLISMIVADPGDCVDCDEGGYAKRTVLDEFEEWSRRPGRGGDARTEKMDPSWMQYPFRKQTN